MLLDIFQKTKRVIEIQQKQLPISFKSKLIKKKQIPICQ